MPSGSSSWGASAAGIGVRRRRRVIAHRPNGPRSDPATRAGATSVPASSAAATAASRDRGDALAAAAVGRRVGVAVRPHADARRRRSAAGLPRTARSPRRDGWNPSCAEHLVRRGRELRAQQRSRATPSARRPRPPRSSARPPAARLRRRATRAQRLGDRLQGAEVGAGAHDDLGARPRAAASTASTSARTATEGRTRWVTSLAPTRITATSGGTQSTQQPVELRLEPGRLGADDGDVVQADGPPGQRRQAGGDDRPRRSAPGVGSPGRPRRSRRASPARSARPGRARTCRTCAGPSGPNGCPISRRASRASAASSPIPVSRQEGQAPTPVRSGGRDAGVLCSRLSTCSHVTARRQTRPPVCRPTHRTIGVKYANTVLDLIGGTPLVRLNHVTEGVAPTVLAKVEYLNPGGSVKDRIAVKMVDAAEESGALQARRDDRRADVRQHRRRAGPGRPAARLPAASSSAPTRSARTSGTCSRPTAPRSWCARRPWSPTTRLLLLGQRPARPRDRGRVEARPVLQPDGPGEPLRDHRPGDLGRHRRQGHALRRRRGHRRHHHRHRPLPQGGLERPRPGRADGSQVIGADPEGSVYSGGTGRPYLVEGVGEDFWPTAYDPPVPDRIVAVSDADSFDMTRRLALRGGPAGRRLVRDGGRGRPRGRARPRPRRRRGRAAARLRPGLPGEDLQRRLDGLVRLRAVGGDGGHRRRRAARQVAATCPTSCTPIPTETVRDAIEILHEYGVSQMPVVKAEPPVMAGEVAGSVSERDLLDAVFSGAASLADPVEKHMAAPLPLVGGGEPIETARAELQKSGRRHGRHRRQAGRCADPRRPARLPGVLSPGGTGRGTPAPTRPPPGSAVRRAGRVRREHGADRALRARQHSLGRAAPGRCREAG